MTATSLPTFKAILLATALSFGLSALPAAAQGGGVVAQAQTMPELQTFTLLVKQAGLDSALTGDVTVFAPSDDAFKAVPAATLDKLGKDPELLKSVLSYHVLPGAMKSSAILGATSKASVQGSPLSVARAGDFITVESAMVIRADVAAGNSVIHVIDTVLIPPTKK